MRCLSHNCGCSVHAMVEILPMQKKFDRRDFERFREISRDFEKKR